MGFKDYMAADISAVFINSKEFGEEHDIDGDKVLIVPDDYTIRERSGSPYEDGTYQNHFAFFVNLNDLGYMPVENQMMQLDGKAAIVQEVKEEMGVIKVVLELNES